MKNWINKNYKTLIIFSFLVPIIVVALVSISHVTTWYGISNPISWSIYLSIGIEIAALSSLAAISAQMGRIVYFPFFIVTLIQFIGNIFFSYQFIEIDGKVFKDWVDLVSPLVSIIGVEPNDLIGHKRFLALFSGGLLPIISLSFLHMLVRFTEQDKLKEEKRVKEELSKELLEIEKEKWEKEFLEKMNTNIVDAKDFISEVSKMRLTDEEYDELEKFLSKKNEQLFSQKEEDKKEETELTLEEKTDIVNKEWLESYDFENEETSVDETKDNDYNVNEITHENKEEIQDIIENVTTQNQENNNIPDEKKK